VAKLVSYAIEQNKSLGKLTITEYKKFSPLFAKDVLAITIEFSLAARDVTGGTAPKQVAKALAAAKKAIGDRGGK
jgi:argininosuccinate lyase